MDIRFPGLAAMLRSETELRQRTEERLQALLPADLGGLTPQALVVQFFDVLKQFADINVQTIS